jgi:hypothetical protein
MISRRHFLRSAGICLSLPPLESLGQAESSKSIAAPKRFIGINNTLGFHLPNFVPTQSGPDYALSPYLQHLAKHRQSFTVLTGLMHTGVDGGHSAERSFLSGAPHPGTASFKNTVSIDQLIADRCVGQTRLPFLNMRTSSDAGLSQSVNVRGQVIPAQEDPRQIFASMCFSGDAKDAERVIADLANDHSVLDHVQEDTRRLLGRATTADRDRLDEFFTSLRSVETRLQQQEIWAAKPKPNEHYAWPAKMPPVSNITELGKILLDMAAIAFRVDATRSVALKLFGTGARPSLKGVEDSYHGLSHHGQDDKKIAQLAIIEAEIMKTLAGFLDQLAEAKNADGSRLLDSATVLFGSSMGNASSHNNSNLPMLVAGGGFRSHGQHLAFDPASGKNPSLSNLYLNLLQHHGVEAERFAASTGLLEI